MTPWRGQRDLPEADALLLHAYLLHESRACPCGCGFPAEVTLDPDAEGHVEVVDDQRCAVRAAMDEWRKENTEPEPGTLPMPTFDERSYRVAKVRRGG